jgi:hypothetical protein
VDPTGLELKGFKGKGITRTNSCDTDVRVNAQIDPHDIPFLAETSSFWRSLGEKVQWEILAYVRAGKLRGGS